MTKHDCIQLSMKGYGIRRGSNMQGAGFLFIPSLKNPLFIDENDPELNDDIFYHKIKTTCAWYFTFTAANERLYFFEKAREWGTEGYKYLGGETLPICHSVKDIKPFYNCIFPKTEEEMLKLIMREFSMIERLLTISGKPEPNIIKLSISQEKNNTLYLDDDMSLA